MPLFTKFYSDMAHVPRVAYNPFCYLNIHLSKLAQSTGAAEHTDCFSAEGLDPNECPVIWH